MNVLIMGDVHAAFGDAEEARQNLFGAYKQVDLFIQVGDFGFWPRLYPNREWSFDADCPCYFIDGNHEDHEILSKLNIPGWTMEKIPQGWIRTMNTWSYKPRGSIENGILYIGGASSINKEYLTPGLNWFPEENISWRQEKMILENIENYGPENIHTVISHDCPTAFVMEEACTYGDGLEIHDNNRKFLQKVLYRARPENWFFGHYHASLSGVHEEEHFQTKWKCIDQIYGPDDPDHVYIELP